jgi:hypothetical protein
MLYTVFDPRVQVHIVVSAGRGGTTRETGDSTACAALAMHWHWAVANTRHSRQSPHDAAAPAVNRRSSRRSFRTIRFDSHVRVRPQSHCATANTRSARWMGRSANRRCAAPAVLTMWQAQMYSHGATGNEARRLDGISSVGLQLSANYDCIPVFVIPDALGVDL